MRTYTQIFTLIFFSIITWFSLPIVLSAQQPTDIYLYNLDWSSGEVLLSEPINCTRHVGYDNQPFFHPIEPIFYYSSFDTAGRSDIKFYNYSKNSTFNFTRSSVREYSPTITPDSVHISCVLQRDNGEQNLVQFPLSTTLNSPELQAPEILISSLVVGYHTWLSHHELLLFVLDDSIHYSLQYYDLELHKSTVLMKNPGRSLLYSPRTHRAYFVDKTRPQKWFLSSFSPRDMSIKHEFELPVLSDFIALSSDDHVFLSDSSAIYYTSLSSRSGTNSWKKVRFDGQSAPAKRISRMAISPDRKRIALVVEE